MKKILSIFAGIMLLSNIALAEEVSIEKQLVGIVGAINGTVKTETREDNQIVTKVKLDKLVELMPESDNGKEDDTS